MVDCTYGKEITPCLPYNLTSQVGMFKIHPTVPECMSEEAKGFIMCCFEPDPDKRATASELSKNRFLKGIPKKRTKPLTENFLIEPAGELIKRGVQTLILKRI